jgi:choline dehydrogenase-like flavoprotein
MNARVENRSSPVQFTCTDARSPTELIWDIVVIGAGVGGASLGLELARRGRKVCFCDLGLDLQNDNGAVRGQALVTTAQERGTPFTDPALRLRHGKYPERVVLNQKQNWLAMGSGTGGGSSTFGNIMDRMSPSDFEPLASFGDVPGAMIPERWPISYAELEPFYRQAEQLFRLRGTWDPLRSEPDPQTLLPPAPMNDKERILVESLRAVGLNPYLSPSACENVPGCTGCAGVLCDKNCRNDAGKICVKPAVTDLGAGLLTRCEITRLVADGRRVTGAVYQDSSGEQHRLRAKAYVLAAGALRSPVILLRSELANSSGLAGRNLMFHVTDVMRVNTKTKPRDPRMAHGLSLNDFYHHGNKKLGNVHFHRMEITTDTLANFLGQVAQNLPSTFLRAVASGSIPAFASIGARLNRNTIIGATIVEDLPFPTNRVTISANGDSQPVLQYQRTDELIHRAKLLRDEFQTTTKDKLSVKWIGNGELNTAHMCGTLRFGSDARSSVLDATNRAHDLDNLYAVDSSFFPTSGGINPSLTIAANALRVAGILDGRL